MTKLIEHKWSLGQIIDIINEEKKYSLSTNLIKKETITKVEIIEEGLEVEQVASLKSQLYAVQKELGLTQTNIQWKYTKIIELKS